MKPTILQPSLFDNDVLAAVQKKGSLRAPFPAFGGKSACAPLVWFAFGDVKQYIEPFAFSAAMLLAAPRPASLEVIGDVNGYVANFWRCVKYQPDRTWAEADYPVSHIDLGARHRWLVEPWRVAELEAQLSNPEWPGDPRIAGWWVWGQCCWIGSGWCESQAAGKIPHVTDAGQGIQAAGQIPHVTNAGQGIQAAGHRNKWIEALSVRLARVRVIHGDWKRTLNLHYGGEGKSAAVFFDPPYVGYEKLYRDKRPVALEVAEWCREHPDVRIALAGHVGDYDLPEWQVAQWSRPRRTFGGRGTKDLEALWFSPACRKVK